MRRLRFLWSYAAKSKAAIFLSLMALTFVSLTSLVYPWLVKHLVDHFETGLAIDENALLLAGALVLVLMSSTVLGYYQQTKMNALGIELRNELRQALYASLLDRPLSFYRGTQVGELSAVATEEIAKVQSLFSQFLAPLYQNTLFTVGCLGLMLYLNLFATLIVLLVMILPLPYVLRAAGRIPYFSIRTQQLQGQAHGMFEETLVAIREIKGFLREQLESKRYGHALQEAKETELEGSSLRVKISQGVYLLLSLVLLAIFFAGVSKSAFPEWTLGGLIAFYFYAYMMTMSVIAVERIYITYQNIAGALDRIMSLLPQSQYREEHRIAILTKPVAGEIQFEKVTFGYEPGNPVLRDAAFTINAGTWALVTGPSGSGKSTLMSLIMGFYEVDRGRVLIDGIELTRDTVRTIRRHIGFVGQDPFLLRGTLRENIAFTESPVTEQQIVEALRISCLSNLVSELPHGLDTIVGERGFTLSGGQRARIAIARAVVSNPAILILDEANAVLEAELEKAFWTNLMETRRNQTTLILTHHPGNIPRVDIHLALTDGMISVSDSGKQYVPTRWPITP